jgi:hypothetical protein
MMCKTTIAHGIEMTVIVTDVGDKTPRRLYVGVFRPVASREDI